MPQSRRRFLKYVGAGAIAGGGAAAVAYLTKDYWQEAEVWEQATTKRTTTSVSVPTETTRINHAPIANFGYKPQYINPTDEQIVQFTNLSRDPDDVLELLSWTWLVDDQAASHEKDYSAKLPVGEHLVQLKVSDDMTDDITQRTITIEPDDTYSVKELKVPVKGVCYFVNTLRPSLRVEQEMEEHLNVMREELGCSGIRIEGYDDDPILSCAETAIDAGFEVMLLCPIYANHDSHETARRVGEFAQKAEKLRSQSDGIVLQVGNEFTFDSAGIIEGSNWGERVWRAAEELGKPGWKDRFRSFIVEVAKTARERFDGRLSYAAMSLEPVPWELFDVVGRNEYIAWYRSASDILQDIRKVKDYRLPVYLTEFGCCSFAGADHWGGEGIIRVGPQYDEEVQAKYIENFVTQVVNKAKVDGCFLFDFDSLQNWDRTWFGIVDQKHRKKGFYMYKSCQRVT